MNTSRADALKVGAIWREKRSGRLVKILEEEVHGTGPAWTYCDAQGNPEPHDRGRHADWFWHYSSLFEFVVFDGFEPVEAKP